MAACKLEQEGLDRGVAVAGVDAVIVGAQYLGVGHPPGHEPVLDHPALAPQHELDADDGIEHVVGIRPRVDGHFAPGRGLTPERVFGYLREVDADRRQGLALGKAEDPVAHVGLGVPFPKMRVQVDREDMSVGTLDPALEPHASPPRGEVDHGFERSYAGHW